MEKETLKQFRLGLFLITGTVLLFLSIYLIGRNQNLFGPTFRIVASFHNVNGLQAGNNVRFSGTDAGTVESIEVVNDTSVRVVLVIQEKYRAFIKNDAIASIGTDGVMGNKLVNIVNRTGSTAALVSDGSSILSLRPVETDEMLRTLNETNQYVSAIALNLKNITDKIGNSRGTVWKLLSDTTLSGRVDSTFISFQLASRNISSLSAELRALGLELNSGKGLLGTLSRDSLIGIKVHEVLASLNHAGDQSANVSDELMRFMSDIDRGKGTLGVLLRDSTVSTDIKTAALNLRQSSESLIQALEAMKKSPLLRKYLEVEEEKEKDKDKKERAPKQ